MRADDLSWLVGELRELAGDLDGRHGAVPLVLAIDQGGHASRVLAFDLGGEQLAESYAPISSFRTRDDRLEHDGAEIIASIRTCLADVAQTLGSDAQRVIAAGIATQRSSIVCWDKRTGQPLTPVLSWQDRRNAKLIAELGAHALDVRAQTGLVLSAHYGASKLRWCLDHVPAVQDAAQQGRLRLGPLAAFIVSSLLEAHPYVVDPANASRTQLWDPSSLTWSTRLGSLFGVPLELLPKCVPTRHIYGQLSFAGKQVPLLVCTGDQSAVPFAFGPIDPSTIYLNLGTGAFLQRPTLSVGTTDLALLESVLYSDDAATISVEEATVNGAASALDWLNERIGIDTHRAALAMTAASAAAEAPLFLNGVGGLGSPFWLAHFESRFDVLASEALQVQAVLESIGFLICTNLERMRDRAGLRRMLVTGGLSRSEYLCEVIAALSSLEVVRTDVKEATARGLAYLIAGQPSGWDTGVASERFTSVNELGLQARYARWRAEMSRSGAG